MLRQVPEHGACTCARRAWRLWAARHSQGEVGPLGAPPLPWVLAPSHLQSRRFHLPPLTTQEPGGRILRRGGRPLRGSPARAAGRRAACGMKHGPVSPCTVVCCREGSYRAPVELRTLKLMSNTGYLTADLPQSQCRHHHSPSTTDDTHHTSSNKSIPLSPTSPRTPHSPQSTRRLPLRHHSGFPLATHDTLSVSRFKLVCILKSIKYNV